MFSILTIAQRPEFKVQLEFLLLILLWTVATFLTHGQQQDHMESKLRVGNLHTFFTHPHSDNILYWFRIVVYTYCSTKILTMTITTVSWPSSSERSFSQAEKCWRCIQERNKAGLGVRITSMTTYFTQLQVAGDGQNQLLLHLLGCHGDKSWPIYYMIGWLKRLPVRPTVPFWDFELGKAPWSRQSVREKRCYCRDAAAQKRKNALWTRGLGTSM